MVIYYKYAKENVKKNDYLSPQFKSLRDMTSSSFVHQEVAPLDNEISSLVKSSREQN